MQDSREFPMLLCELKGYHAINIIVICFTALLTHLNSYLCSKDIASEKPMMQVGQYVFAGEYEGKKSSIFFSDFINYSQNRCTPPPTVHDIVNLFKKYYGRRHPAS